MAKEKQHVFSARTTEEGLRLLNGIRRERDIGWDKLVIEAVSAYYNLDKAIMSLLKKEKPAKETPNSEHQTEEQPAEERLPEAKQEEAPTKKQRNKNRK